MQMLESIIYGVGYEMTPTEDELAKRRAFSYRGPLRAPKKDTRRLSWRKFLSKVFGGGSFIAAKQQAAAQQAAAANHSQHDRVPPLGGYQWPADQTPGVTGLRNHGNTCFMNAVLQCLSHTDILAEYFVLDQYKADLKRRNKINSKKFGTKGELTEQLALVLKALWTCRDTPEHSSSFKAVVDRYSSQFRSSTQHDAQEFLFWLLDKVHEDLNTATKKRYKTIKNNYGRPDEVIAAETLANHIRCNNSFVQAVFQAQFRSSLTCPRCEKQSNTFDPFHCISVQLPQLVQQPVYVTVVYTSQHPKQVKLGLTVAPGSSMVALKEQLHLDTGIAMERILLTEVMESGFSRVFCDSHPISAIKESDPIFCIETPKLPETSSSATSASVVHKEHTKIILCILNVHRKEKAVESEPSGEKSGDETVKKDETTTKSKESKEDKSDQGEMVQFGSPLCIQVNRDISYSELQRLLLKEMASVLRSEVFAFTTPVTDMYKIRLQDPSADPDTYLNATVAHPLFTEMIDLALSVVPSDAGPPHVKLHLEWSKPERFFSDMSDPTVEHASVAQLKADKVASPSLSLEQCLDHYTKAETLSAEDAWRCPHCQKYLPVVKTLGLWSLPDILVIHFKRFRQHQLKGPQAAKLTTMVKFPMFGFDMAPHLAKPDNNEKGTAGGGSIGPSDTKYDLYAVCYHQGNTLETGHYTAACCNPYDQQWYRFDDQRVTHVPKERVEEEIINEEAYMLFYQRRRVDGSECSSGSASSTSSGEHWISRIAPPNVLAKAAENLSSNNKSEKVIPEKEEVEVKIQDELKVESVEETKELTKDLVVVDKKEEKAEAKETIIESVLNVVVEGEAVEKEKETPEIENAEEVVEPEQKACVEDAIEEVRSSIDELDAQVEKVEKEVNEIVKEEDEDPVKDEVVVVRKSSPIAIQRSSAPLNWSKAFDDSLSGNLRHSSLSYTNSMRTRDFDTNATVSLLRASSSCSKDTFLFMDHHHPYQRHLHHRSAGRSLIDEDGVLGAANHSLWISPVSSHKLITVSPKN